MPYSKVKITVLKRTFNKDAVDECASGPWEPFSMFKGGQEFTVDGLFMPQGFCSWAWADIEKYVQVLVHGGNFSGSKEGMTVACCTDGYRPVIFKLEKLTG
ncbi:TIGR04076 family protein [bacterium]|nr:MAG: TIGR04076 family protein [bacterium]